MRLEGKVVLVTAATNGIGKAIAHLCSKEGATVYIGARNMEKASGVIESFNEEGLNAKAVYNDASKKETFVSMIEEVVENEGRIDVLVNNFGGSNPRKDLDIKSTDYEEFINTVDSNLSSVFISSQKAIEYMAKQGGGSIINISSVASTSPDISQIGYGCFQYEDEARAFYQALGTRLAKFNLELAEEKSNIIFFGKEAYQARKAGMV